MKRGRRESEAMYNEWTTRTACRGWWIFVAVEILWGRVKCDDDDDVESNCSFDCGISVGVNGTVRYHRSPVHHPTVQPSEYCTAVQDISALKPITMYPRNSSPPSNEDAIYGYRDAQQRTCDNCRFFLFQRSFCTCNVVCLNWDSR